MNPQSNGNFPEPVRPQSLQLPTEITYPIGVKLQPLKEQLIVRDLQALKEFQDPAPMNEHDILKAALAIEAPVDREALLKKTSEENGYSRQRFDALLASNQAESNEFAMDDVSKTQTDDNIAETIVGTPGELEKSSEDASDQPDLSFLVTTSREGSIGRLGHYEIQKVLGTGGFGIVFQAFDEKLHRLVAINVLGAQMAATSPARKRFLCEARSTSAIKHVMQVYSVEEQPLPFLVMEYVEGQTLADRLNDGGPLSVEEILILGQQIATGLAAAHAKGMIHRDIKPANILLEQNADGVAANTTGKVKITDFGLARAADDASLTQSGTIVGTPMYMAPELRGGAKFGHFKHSTWARN